MGDLASDEKKVKNAQNEIEAAETNECEQHIAATDDGACALTRSEKTKDEPRLATKLCRHPARGCGDVGKRKCQHQYPQQATGLLQPAAKALDVRDDHQQDEHGP